MTADKGGAGGWLSRSCGRRTTSRLFWQFICRKFGFFLQNPLVEYHVLHKVLAFFPNSTSNCRKTKEKHLLKNSFWQWYDSLPLRSPSTRYTLSVLRTLTHCRECHSRVSLQPITKPIRVHFKKNVHTHLNNLDLRRGVLLVKTTVYNFHYPIHSLFSFAFYRLYICHEWHHTV